MMSISAEISFIYLQFNVINLSHPSIILLLHLIAEQVNLTGTKTGDWRLETGDWRLETGGWRLETGDWKRQDPQVSTAKTSVSLS